MALAIPKKKEDEVKKVKEEEPEQDPINLDDPKSRMDFLKGQLDDLLDNINNTYGQELMEELLGRLERTVEDFNEQVTRLIGRLKDGKIFEADVEPPPNVLGTSEAEVSDEPETDSEEVSDEEAAAAAEAEDEDIVKRMMRRAGQAEE